jgi:hypothetical protein
MKQRAALILQPSRANNREYPLIRKSAKRGRLLPVAAVYRDGVAHLFIQIEVNDGCRLSVIWQRQDEGYLAPIDVR